MENPPRIGQSVASDMLPDEDEFPEIDYSELEVELNSWRFDEEVLQSLVTRSSQLHLSMLFYRNSKNRYGELCWMMYKVIIKRIGGTMSYGGLNGWRDMAVRLGLKMEDVDYIEHSVKMCPTEMSLRVVIQHDYACFDKLLLVLQEMERYDVIKFLQEPLTKILDMARIDEHSQNKPVRPRYLTNFLPDVLRVTNSDDDEDEDPDENKNKLDNDSTDIANLKDAKEDMIMLTYAADGLKVAEKICSKLKKKAPNLKVVVLEDSRSEMMENAERTIRKYIHEVDYVIPILTTGYFAQIESTSVGIPSLTDNLDHTYAQYIYKLCTDHYIHGTGCFNKKVRPIVPNKEKEVPDRLSLYSLLIAYTWEKDLDLLLHSRKESTAGHRTPLPGIRRKVLSHLHAATVLKFSVKVNCVHMLIVLLSFTGRKIFVYRQCLRRKWPFCNGDTKEEKCNSLHVYSPT